MACGADHVVAPRATAVDTTSSAASVAFAQPVASSTAIGTATAVPSMMAFSTYDGSGEVVHPDVVTFPERWNGHRFWNAITPYPGSATRFENPSLFGSNDGDEWTVPAGVTNPLARTSRGYLSDPDMLFEPTSGKLWLYYREVENRRLGTKGSFHIADHVWVTTSSDARNWSAPRRVASDSMHYVVSPTIVRTPDGAWRMYQVDAGKDGCSSKASRVMLRRSEDGVDWSASAPTGLVQPGYVPWHLDVQYVPARAEYWALLAAYVSGRGCTTTSLFLATSRDGSTWTSYPTPVLAPGELPAFESAVYRSTFSYVSSDSITIWYSGARVAKAGTKKRPAVFAWSAAVTHTSASALFARLNDATRGPSLAAAAAGRATLPPANIAP